MSLGKALMKGKNRVGLMMDPRGDGLLCQTLSKALIHKRIHRRKPCANN